MHPWRPRPRTALLLSRVEGWSHARIAGHLQVSERMVAKYIASGLQQLRPRLRAENPMAAGTRPAER